MLQEQVIDAMIAPSNTVDEWSLEHQSRPPFFTSELPLKKTSRVHLMIAGPERLRPCFSGAGSPVGLRIATSYPHLTEKYLVSIGATDCPIVMLAGGVEIAVRRGMADAVVDIVETGNSLRAENLQAFANVGAYCATVYSRPQLGSQKLVALSHFLGKLQQAEAQLADPSLAA